MSLYQCDECGCVENTALGFYHTRNIESMWTEEYLGRKLCSACGPTHFKSGEKTDLGKWHNRFERMYLPKGEFITNNQGNLAHKETGDTNYSKYEIKKCKFCVKPCGHNHCPVNCEEKKDGRQCD